MDQRLARVTLAATLLLLLGCSPGSTTPDRPASPAGLPRSSAGPSGAPSAVVVAPATSTPEADVAAQEEQVRAASRRFVTSVLTIGYPDRTYREYTDRIEPLMTESGFDALVGAGSATRTADALASLYAQRSRSAPRFARDPEVTSLEGDRATAQLAYENVSQRKEGRGWRTVRSLGEGTVTVRLVRQDQRWLVEVAS